ncbi:MAG: hypothetical protein ACYDHY_17490 [Acidiferrobacterales bacterium]
MNPGINVQLQALTPADVPDLRRFTGGALVIADWPEHVPETLAVLEAAGVAVGMWRFTQDPRGWPGWPADYLKRCVWAVLANEPDIEGKAPGWYNDAIEAWGYAGGKPVEPAWSDEDARYNDGIHYAAVSAHVYPLGLGAANLAAVRARAAGRPVYVTEFGIAGQQQTCLQQMAALGITEPTYLYSYRARDAQAQPQYDLAGVALMPVTTPQPPKEPPMPMPELNQGWSMACHSYAVAECFDDAGAYVSPFDVYAQGMGEPLVLPGRPASFDQLRAEVNAAGAMTHHRIKWFGPLGICNDPATFDQLVKDGWYVIAGVKESDLIAGQNYGHYVVARKIDFNGDGTPELEIIDSYRAQDGGSDRYPLAQFHQAMADNWDAGVDALAFQIVAA